MAAAMAARGRKRERKEELERQKEYSHHLEQERLSEWLVKFDKDGDQNLNKREFRELMANLDTDADVEMGVIDALFAKCDHARENGGTVTEDTMICKEEIPYAVGKYRSLVIHEKHLTKIMERFDCNRDGQLDRAEVRRLLEAVLRDGGKLQAASGREYKIATLEALLTKGILTPAEFQKKITKMNGGGPASGVTEITDADVDFVFAEADRDSSGSVDKFEIMTGLAMWTKLLNTAPPDKKEMGGSSSCCIV